jgi:D-glycero-D-manno-heptose 1,7-bisphosphate phosphatase
MPGKALFLDRDGVINVDHGYVASIDRFAFQDGIFPLTRRAVDAGYRIVVVTNQSGIARGYYDEAAFAALTVWMAARFAGEGVALAAVLHCPYHRAGCVPAFARDSFWRKPNPGMILEAALRLNLDLGRSLLLGDQGSDMAAGRAAGVGRCLLLNPAGGGAGGGADDVHTGLADAVVTSPAGAMAWLAPF